MKACRRSLKAHQHLAKPFRQSLKPGQLLPNPARQRLKRHQLAINDHRQALNQCKQPINALASSPDAFAISINNRAILKNPPANSLINFAASPDDHESSKKPENPQFYHKRLDANAHRFNLLTRHQSSNNKLL
jgi:hypothetical protein